MNDLEYLLNIKKSVLSQLENMFPISVNVLAKKNYLCYFIKSESGNVTPVVDFAREMPDTMDEYRKIINISAVEYLTM